MWDDPGGEFRETLFLTIVAFSLKIVYKKDSLGGLTAETEHAKKQFRILKKSNLRTGLRL